MKYIYKERDNIDILRYEERYSKVNEILEFRYHSDYSTGFLKATNIETSNCRYWLFGYNDGMYALAFSCAKERYESL